MGPCIAMKRRPLQTRSRGSDVSVKFQLGDVWGVPDGPTTGLTQNQVKCNVHAKSRLLLKSMYPDFGSRRWVARDTGTYIRYLTGLG